MSSSKDQSKVTDEDIKGESASPTSTTGATGARRRVTWSPEVTVGADPVGRHKHHSGPGSFRKSHSSTLPHSSSSSSKQSENEYKEIQEKKKRASDKKKKEEIMKMLKSGNIDVYKELLLQEVEGAKSDKKGISKSTYRFKRCVFDPNCKSLPTTDLIEKAELDRIVRKSDGKGKVQFFSDVLNAMTSHYDVAHTETDSDKILITFILDFLKFVQKELEELTSAS